MAPKLTVPYFLETYVILYDVLVRFFTETELIGLWRKRLILRIGSHNRGAGLASQKPAGQVCRLETQRRAGTAVLNLKAT